MVEPISRHDPLEIGWMAGIIDGEGHIGLVRQSFYKGTGEYTLMPDIHVANTDYELLRRYTEILHQWGVHFHYCLGRRQPHYRSLLSVRVGRINSAERLLGIVTEHLTAKKPVAEIVLEFCHWKQSLRLLHRERKRDKNGRILPGRIRTGAEVTEELKFYERAELAKQNRIDVSTTTRIGSQPLEIKV